MDRRLYHARLAALPSQLRVAVGATCVDRVLPIFDALSDDSGEVLHAAVALAWRHAGGSVIGQAELRSMVDAILAVEGHDDESMRALDRIVAQVTLAVRNLLTALDEFDSVPAIRVADAAEAARHAVFLLEKYEDLAVNCALDEDEWQEGVLALAEESGDAAALRAFGGAPVWRAYFDRF